MQTMFTLCLLLLVVDTNGIESPREIGGYQAGFMADCPGSTKEAIITKKTRKKLAMLVQTSNTTRVVRRRYDYYHMKELAQDPDIDFSKDTMMFVGGFISSPNFPFSTSMGTAYKELGYNVIMLDTLEFTTMEYPLAARFMRPVGKHTAKMLVDLTREGLDPKKLHVIGMSLGGQTISFIAKQFREQSGRNISRVTALEPAGPCFRNLGPNDRLDKSDADFVDVINTNIDTYGMPVPVGHVNFYINGGEYQPGDLFWMFCPELCSHTRSFGIWLSALKHPESFIGIQCDSVQQARDKNCYDRVPQVTNVVGTKTDKSKEGIFYVATSQNEPYYLGKKGLKRENDFLPALIKSFNEEDIVKM